MASSVRYVLLVVGGFTAGLVLAAPSVDTYPLADGFLPGPVFTSDVAAAAAGGLAALAVAASIRRRALAPALVGAMVVAVVALPGGWRFDMYAATIGAGLLLGALVVLGTEKLHTALAGAVVAGLLTAEPLAQFRELDSAPQRYASYLAASVQPVNAVWLPLAIVTAVAAGVVALTAANDTAPVARARGREVAVGIGVPILGVGLYWSFHHALFSLDDAGEGRWLLGLVAVPVLIAAALWLRGRTGAVLLAATAVVVAVGGTVSWSPAAWPALLIAPALVAVGVWLGRRRPIPLIGVGLLALAAAAGIFDRPPWDNANFVATILVVPFAAAYSIVASLPSTAPVTATSLTLLAVLALPLLAQFGWTAYTPLTDDPAGWSPECVDVDVGGCDDRRRPGLRCGDGMASIPQRERGRRNLTGSRGNGHCENPSMPDSTRGYFTESDGTYLPTKYAVSPWSSTMLAGPCVTGLLARELDKDHGPDGFVPARLTVDLFRPVQNAPVRFETTRVRDGNRIRVADAYLIQGDDVTARGTVVYLRPSEQPPGTVWTRDEHPTPPAEAFDGPETGFARTWFGSDAHPEGWSQVRAEHQNASRKRMWSRQIPVLVGEEMSPFVRTAVVGEGTSFMANWSDEGVGFINGDLTLTLSRLPVGTEVGVEADHHLSADGVAVGTSVLFDRLGPFGTGAVTCLANARRQVNFG